MVSRPKRNNLTFGDVGRLRPSNGANSRPFDLRVCASTHTRWDHFLRVTIVYRIQWTGLRVVSLEVDHRTRRSFAVLSKVGDVGCFNHLRGGVLRELCQCQEFSGACAPDAPG